jgi:hypothetical protein
VVYTPGTLNQSVKNAWHLCIVNHPMNDGRYSLFSSDVSRDRDVTRHSLCPQRHVTRRVRLPVPREQEDSVMTASSVVGTTDRSTGQCCLSSQVTVTKDKECGQVRTLRATNKPRFRGREGIKI